MKVLARCGVALHRISYLRSTRALATTSMANSGNDAKAATSVSDIPISIELSSLVDKICALDLIQTAQLITMLKKKLNLPDVVATPVVASTSVVPNGGTSMTPAASTPPTIEKTEFRVTLEKFDAASKAKIIREIKALLPQMNLVEAKTFVESAPKLIKEKVKKEDAEKIKKTMEELGAVITLD